MPYVYLAAAIIFEILGTISMKYAEGFTKVIPSVLIFVCYGICFVSLTIALKSLPVSMVYAIWAGVGTAIMAVVGLLMFGEPLPLQKILATSLIILGVVILNFSGGKHQDSDQVVEVEKKEIKRIPAEQTLPVIQIRERIAERNSG
ncbi:MAG: DMT family transporter [Bacillota bacterium]